MLPLCETFQLRLASFKKGFSQFVYPFEAVLLIQIAIYYGVVSIYYILHN